MTRLAIDPAAHPTMRFRIDNFSVPEGVRPEVEAAMHRNLAFLQTLPGFVGHVVFERTGGPTTFNLVTIAAWENQEALDAAGVKVRAYYESIGFDVHAMLARWGVKAELGNFGAPPELQRAR